MIATTQCRPMEVLLVEDSLIDARVTMLALKRCNIHHRVSLVRTASEARRFLNREGIFRRAPRPDLVLLDLLLPDEMGTDLLHEVRETEEINDTPVVVLSASGDAESKDRCESLQVDDYIEKPVDEAKFLRVVHEHKRLIVFGARATETFSYVS